MSSDKAETLVQDGKIQRHTTFISQKVGGAIGHT